MAGVLVGHNTHKLVLRKCMLLLTLQTCIHSTHVHLVRRLRAIDCIQAVHQMCYCKQHTVLASSCQQVHLSSTAVHITMHCSPAAELDEVRRRAHG